MATKGRDWRAPALLGLAVVGAAAVSFFFAAPAAKKPAPTTSAGKPVDLFDPKPPPQVRVVTGPSPSGASSVMKKPIVSPLGPDDVIPDPPLSIASEVPPPFDVPDGGCPEGSARTTVGRGSGCAYKDADGGVVVNGPWEIKRSDTRFDRGQMFDGKRVGPWTLFDEKGRQLVVTFYGHDGQMEGPERELDGDGNVIAERWFSQGRLHGTEVRRTGEGERRTKWYLGRKLGEEIVIFDAGAAPAPTAP